MDIYVGNLPYKAADEDLKGLFAAHGEVTSSRVVMDRDSGQSKGFGFIEMPNREEALKAIEALNNYDLMGRKLRVNESQPKPREDRRGGGGGGGGGFRGGPREGGGGDRNYRSENRESRW
jgi:RNA recognition motif-containing protein